MQIKDRIRGYLPVVIDIETGGFNDKTDAMLEISFLGFYLGTNGLENLIQRLFFTHCHA
jgi:ribonuclease T